MQNSYELAQLRTVVLFVREKKGKICEKRKARFARKERQDYCAFHAKPLEPIGANLLRTDRLQPERTTKHAYIHKCSPISFAQITRVAPFDDKFFGMERQSERFMYKHDPWCSPAEAGLCTINWHL